MAETSRYVIFECANERFAVPLGVLREVVPLSSEPTPVPFTPSYFSGIVNLRGQIVSIVNLGKKLGLSASQVKVQGEDEVSLICELKSLSIGFRVDRVIGVEEISADSIGPSPLPDKQGPPFIAGVFHHEGKLVIVLDLASVLTTGDFSFLKATLHG